MNHYLHPTAIVDDGAQIGTGTKIWHWVHICNTAKIGDNCVLGQNVFIGNQVQIGNGVKIQNNVSVYHGVTLADDVFCGPSVVFTNVINPRSFIDRKPAFQPTLVNQGATIGANATILCGNTIGRYALIGAGSVVTKEVRDYALMIGNPAQQIGWICRCGIKLTSLESKSSDLATEVICKECGEGYVINADRCISKRPVQI
jgi:UDP-2-acetamido-3-amino-2,3-dideoxy-glucuronate N-acetyltransferase